MILNGLQGLDAGRNHILSVYDLSQTSGRSLPGTVWAAEQGLPFRFYLFELSWWKSVDIIDFEIWFFSSPNILVSQTVVKSALEVVWIEACSRKCGVQVSGSCQSSAESLSRSCLLRFTLSSCRSVMEPKWLKLFRILETYKSEHTS